ncbi:MAG: 1-acyl-sn-glycerol-3-phosphate acyltransferase [Chitinophagales bacterium]
MKHSSLFYHFIKPFIKLCLKIFFRRIEVDGLEQIPKNAPILFTPNHQSAFMDAIVVACVVPQAVHSVTRALVFEKPAIAWILKKLNMMPIYRIRNGIQNLAKNEATFDHCVNLLQHNQSVLIFPEGSQNVIKKVRSLSKGFSRIVFRAEESQDFKMGLQIIPVGINYSQTTQFRGDLYLRFGKPMTVQHLQELYREQPQKAMNQLRKKLQVELQKEVIHIGNSKHYETFKFLSFQPLTKFSTVVKVLPKTATPLQKKSLCFCASVFNLQKKTLQNFEKIATNEPEKMQKLDEKVKTYRQLLKEVKLNPEVLSDNFQAPIFAEKMKVFLLAPIGIYGYLNHFLPCKITQYLTYKLFKDPSFFASMKLGFGLLFILFFYFLQTILVGVFAQSAAIAGLYLVSVLISGSIVLWMEESFQKWRLSLQKEAVKRRNPLKWKELENLRKEIIGDIEA